MLESLLPVYIRNVLLGLIALEIVLFLLARKMPHLAWLQLFNFADHRTPEQKVRARQSADMLAGFEMILAGIAVPAVYLVGSIMFFNEPTRIALLLVGALSFVLMGSGVRAIVKAGRGDR